VKVYLIAFGALIIASGLTFFGFSERYLNPELSTHSRMNHYMSYAVEQYKDSKDQALGPIQFISSDKTHGLVGLDPWGSPYEYFINKRGTKKLTITLWSKGKDGKSLLKSNDIEDGQGLSKKGDDFIFSKSIKI